jgi:hypothetical protein
MEEVGKDVEEEVGWVRGPCVDCGQKTIWAGPGMLRD